MPMNLAEEEIMYYFSATPTPDQRVQLPCGATATRGLRGYNEREGENIATEVANAAAEHGYVIITGGVTFCQGFHKIRDIVMQKEA